MKNGFLIAITITLLSYSCVNNAQHNTNIIVDTSTPLPSQQSSKAQELSALEKPYHPKDDANAKIDSLIQIAKVNGKRIILQAGGNWCIWCLRFEKYRKSEPTVMSILNQHYLYYHLNYSKENKNEIIFAKYKDPGQFGYPVFVVLDSDGTLLSIQESGSLEDGGSYHLGRVVAFLNKWIKQ